MTLDELLKEVDECGLMVNNICQLEEGGWQANIRGKEYNDKGEKFHEVAFGETIFEALYNCMLRAEEKL